MRMPSWTARDIELLKLISKQQVTGYFMPSLQKDFFRLLSGEKITRQVLRFEHYGLLSINRNSPVRYEFSLTEAGRKIAHKYRMPAGGFFGQL